MESCPTQDQALKLLHYSPISVPPCLLRGLFSSLSAHSTEEPIFKCWPVPHFFWYIKGGVVGFSRRPSSCCLSYFSDMATWNWNEKKNDIFLQGILDDLFGGYWVKTYWLLNWNKRMKQTLISSSGLILTSVNVPFWYRNVSPARLEHEKTGAPGFTSMNLVHPPPILLKTDLNDN